MDLFVNEVISFFREHMSDIPASEFFDKLIYDADVQIPEIFVLLDPNTKDRIEYKAYRALRRAVELAHSNSSLVLEAAVNPARAATSDEVIGLRREATALKEVVADLSLENRLLKKA